MNAASEVLDVVAESELEAVEKRLLNAIAIEEKLYQRYLRLAKEKQPTEAARKEWREIGNIMISQMQKRQNLMLRGKGVRW
jgi:hypothetical protein